MTTPADALEVMMAVSACHHRTAPRMDDEQAALATARIWADLFSVYQLDLADLVAAVKKRATTNPEAPEPAEIIQFAREIRRERAERESEAARQAREDRRDAALEARNRDRLAAITASFAESKAIPDA